jgi:methylmalonyl-CoA mutase cobalamin-binding subunit
MRNKVLGAALGTCVHVGGLHHFLKLAETEGFKIHFLGPAVSVEKLVRAIQEESPVLVAVSYRLRPEVAEHLFRELRDALAKAKLQDVRLVFGGTPPVAEVARRSGLFEKSFDGREPQRVIRDYLRGGTGKEATRRFAHNLLGRIQESFPYPLLRHHFGLSSLEATIAGAKVIAEAEVLDVLSLGPDQNAQEHFFHPDEMDLTQEGAGGVPLRRPQDLRAIFENTRCGNYPLVRCYSGTRDLLRWAKMSLEALHNAWAAIPLCWYSVLDGRSRRTLVEAIQENQEAMRWYAERSLPVEVNEAHQWSLREAHDALAVATAFLAAYNAKKMGVKHYVAQYMFNTPPGTTPQMDIAKMLAKKDLIETLEDDRFTSYRQVRAGIAHFSPNPFIAKGQLAASAVISLALKPHILHVVGFSEGDHAALPQEVIQSCQIIHGVLQDCLEGLPDMSLDPAVQARKEKLLSEARILLQALSRLGSKASPDPWTDPRLLAHAIRYGLLDAPHFKGNPGLCGEIVTRLIDGGWFCIDQATGEPLTEEQRTEFVMEKIPPLEQQTAEEKNGANK